jgi:hypothetical protein
MITKTIVKCVTLVTKKKKKKKKKKYTKYCCGSSGLKFVKAFTNPNVVPNSLKPNNYYRACDRSFSHKHNYYKHLSSAHHMIISTPL